MENEAVKEFRARVEEFTKQYLATYKPKPYRNSSESKKVIHDPVWGSTYFYSWEMAVLDSPLLQRLRLIKQVGMAHLVYPTARHTRFDHTLGVMSLVSRIASALNEKAPSNTHVNVSKPREYDLRMAAALHDVGHCLFSHVSERIYMHTKEFKSVSVWLNSELNVDPKPHEIMSYLIVTSDQFRQFFDRVMDDTHITPQYVKQQLDLEFVANAIVGYWKGKPRERYLVEIICGPLDADKLDYLARDAYFAGLSIVYDINRYMVTIHCADEEMEPVGNLHHTKKSLALKLPLSGITALEQILISKMMLYSYMYHHQKVLAAESMLMQVFEDFSKGGTVELDGMFISHPVDLLYHTDDAVERLLNSHRGQPTGAGDASTLDICLMLARRDLVKRALVFSRLFVKHLCDEQGPNHNNALIGFNRLVSDLSEPASRRLFRRDVYERALPMLDDDRKRGFSERTVIIDFPMSPDVKEVENMVVPTEPTGDAEVELKKLFPLKEWAESYGALQWRGYVFTVSGYRKEICDATIELVKEKYGLELTQEAVGQCSIPITDCDSATTAIMKETTQLSLDI